MKFAIVVGTRPEIIKMAPLILECQRQKIPFTLIHSNQHYSKDMDEIFFKDLKLPAPDHNLNIGSGKHGNQTGQILIRIEPILEAERPDVVFVQGDTNTTAAAALAASKLGIRVAHIEAGLRSYDKRMPEETNRVMTDHMSDYLFAVTDVQKQTLLGEGIQPQKVHVVGNTVADTLLENISLVDNNFLSELNLQPRGYALVTIHRASNVDTKPALEEILKIFASLQQDYPLTFVWPIHPRTKKRLEEYNLSLPENVKALDPLNYFHFIELQKNADLIFTDSGGIQEEACILKVPCITLRENTERPETIEVGANRLTGLDVNEIRKAMKYFAGRNRDWSNPFGDGQTAKKIVTAVTGQNFARPLQGQKVSVIGLGYMGLPFACLLSNAGHFVKGFDIDESKVEQIQDGVAPFEEEGMGELLNIALASGRFSASTSLFPADVFVISVPTPVNNQKCDLQFVEKALGSIAEVAEDGNLIILESTVRPATCSELIVPYFEQKNLNVEVAFCPERAIPGQTLHELVHNDRIVGGHSSEATKLAVDLYASFVKGQIFETNATTAETVKLMENSYRDINIATANEFSQIADEVGVNIWEAIGLANKHPRVNILNPGPGVGGHCIAIDSWFLAEKSASATLIPTARAVNDKRPMVVSERVQSLLKGQANCKIGLLGVAYKKNVDDCRETPATPIRRQLIENQHEVEFFDPFVENWGEHSSFSSIQALDEWADFLILVTDHDYFADFRPKSPLLDTRGFLRKDTL